ncbi:MAG TPA: TonB-dependent receptor [Opitutaceae bacterium]|nr:TonB-dependent receptor [Opitutaceae bacterium]
MLIRHSFKNVPVLATGLIFPVLAASAAGQTAAHDAVVDLPDYVVSATRTAQDVSTTTSSVDVLPLVRLDLAQIDDLRTALGTIPGVNIVNTGAVGGQSSVFIRGSASTQTLFVVDGIPMNSRSAGYNNFLGAADLAGLDRIEVLRGPQSTLYGSAAMGGVIFIDSARGCGAPTGSVATTFGSFDTLGASAVVKGGVEKFGYSASLARFHTDNDKPHNGFDSWSYSTRFEGTPTESLVLGATFRGQQGDAEEYVYGDATVASDNHLATVYAQWNRDKEFASRLTAGQQQRRYTYTSSYTTEIRDRRDVIDWQNTWFDFQGAELVGGATYEHDRHVADGATDKTDNAAGYFSTTVHPTKESTVNAGLRYDDFDTFGSAWTWRTGASWFAVAGTKLHASIGTGFCAPSQQDIDGNPAWGMLGNPALNAEKSTGWDLGVDQHVFGEAVVASVTYFDTRYRDRIVYVSDPVTWIGQMQNVNRARASGFETAATVGFTKTIRARVAYTYLEARDLTEDKRLARQPRHALDAELTAQPFAAWTIGAGLHVVASRVDTYVPLEDYTTVRLFTSYEVVKNLLLKARIENALNEKYQEVTRYDALPFRAFGGVEYKF